MGKYIYNKRMGTFFKAPSLLYMLKRLRSPTVRCILATIQIDARRKTGFRPTSMRSLIRNESNSVTKC